MDPHLPFLRAIAADPADDLPRLVYADFLEETGDAIHAARAHFIRTQIALESLRPRTREHREAKALEGRLREMFLHNWLFDLPEYLRREDRVTWRRGFPDAVRLGVGFTDDFGEWLTLDLFDLHPIRRVHVERMWGWGAVGWASRVRWTRVSELRLGPGFVPLDQDDQDTPAFDELMTYKNFTALRSLDLSENPLSDAWLVRFVSRFPDASFATSLEELDLSRCFEITDAGANTLATARGLDRLTALNLEGVPLTPPAVAMLRRRFGGGLRV